MKPVLQLAAVGVVGVIAWKLLSGVLFGLLFTVLKIAFIVGLAFLAMWAFKRWNEKKDENRGGGEAKGESPAQ